MEKNGKDTYMCIAHEERLQRIEHDSIKVAAEMSMLSTTLLSIREDIAELVQGNKETNKTLNRLLIDPKKTKISLMWHNWWGKVLLLAITSGGGAIASLILERMSSHH